jgi:hypothetical protein
MDVAIEHRHLVRELRSAAGQLTRLAEVVSKQPNAAGDAASQLVNIATTVGQGTRAAAALHALNTAMALLDELPS